MRSGLRSVDRSACDSGVLHRLRLALIGSVLVGLGIIAHTLAAGSISVMGFGIAALLGFELAIPISRGVIKRAPLVLSIFGAELLIHMSLCVTSHTVDPSTVSGFIPSAAMLFWHGVAAVLAMSAIVFLDSIYTAWTRMVAAVIGGISVTVLPEVGMDAVAIEIATEFTHEFLVATDVSRGPPAYALCA